MATEYQALKTAELAEKIRHHLGMQQCKDLSDFEVVEAFCIADDLYPNIQRSMLPKVIAAFDTNNDLSTFRAFLRRLRSADSKHNRVDRGAFLTIAYFDEDALHRGFTARFCEVRTLFHNYECAIPYRQIEALIGKIDTATAAEQAPAWPRIREAAARLFDALWELGRSFDPDKDSMDRHQLEMRQLQLLISELDRSFPDVDDSEWACRIDILAERIAARSVQVTA